MDQSCPRKRPWVFWRATSSLSFQALAEIFDAVEQFYNKFYFRPKYIARSIMKMVADGNERRKLLREGRQYLDYMRKRKGAQG